MAIIQPPKKKAETESPPMSPDPNLVTYTFKGPPLAGLVDEIVTDLTVTISFEPKE
jgi:hypothetical protein